MTDDVKPSDGPGVFRLLRRMLFLSDALFAIVLTLLVLDLRLPDGAADTTVFPFIAGRQPRLLALAIMFGLDSVFWITHVYLLRRLRAFDWPVAWINLAFLFTIAMTPFASTLLGDYSVRGDAWRVYCLALVAIGVAQTILLLVIHNRHAQLTGGIVPREFWHRFALAMAPVVAFAIGLALNPLGLRGAAVLLSFILIPLALFITRMVFATPPPPLPPARRRVRVGVRVAE
jgi:uncharacterized membrane protein